MGFTNICVSFCVSQNTYALRKYFRKWYSQKQLTQFVKIRSVTAVHEHEPIVCAFDPALLHFEPITSSVIVKTTRTVFCGSSVLRRAYTTIWYSACLCMCYCGFLYLRQLRSLRKVTQNIYELFPS